MSDDERIFQGKYKQFPIFWTESTTEGGRSLVVRQFPNKDTQNVEDTGQIPRRFRMKLCVFAAKISSATRFTYFGYRNELLRILESSGPGVLIHPLYGRLEEVYAGKYEVREEQGEFGKGSINLVFEVSNNSGVPVITQNTFTNAEALNDQLLAAVSSSFSAGFSVSPTAPGNFADAATKATSFSSAIETAIEYKTTAVGRFEAVRTGITDFADTVNAKVLSATDMANGVMDLIEKAYEVYEDPEAAFLTVLGMFGFGSGDIAIVQNTVARAERLANRILFNDLINSSALSYAYQATASREFGTTGEIDIVRTQLDDQYGLVRDSGLDGDALDLLESNRVVVNDILDNAAITARTLIPIFTPELPARVLSFNYYGNEDSAERIARTNGLFDISFVSGELDVLTA